MSDLQTAFDEALTELETETPTPDEPAKPSGDEDTEVTEEEVDATEEDFPVDDDEEADEESGEEQDEDADEVDEDSDEDSEAEVDEQALDADATYTLPDGSEVTGDELGKGYLRQADYTRKTQELAEERRQVQQVYDDVRQWYETRAADPAGWVREIISETDDPSGTLGEIITATQDPTATIAWLIRHTAEQGALSEQFVKTFGLEEVVRQAGTTRAESRIERLERELQAERERTDQDARTQEILSELQGQWREIVSTNGMSFSSSEDEAQARAELAAYARDNGIPDLRKAYAARSYEQGSQPRPKPKKQPSRKKQSTRAVQRTRPGGSRPADTRPESIDDAIRMSAQELGLA